MRRKRFPRSTAEDCQVPIVQKSEESPRYRNPMSSMEWWEAVERIREEISALDQEKAQHSMHCITWGIEWLDPVMHRYCMETCPTCQTPCCTGKEVFFNQADLLYLTALNTQIPPGQTRSHPWEACRYLGEKGCMLSRFHRPYVCVWFLCDAQMNILSREPNRFQRRFLETLQKIRAHRLALESLYEGNQCTGSLKQESATVHFLPSSEPSICSLPSEK